MQRALWIIVGLAIVGLSGLVHEAGARKKDEDKQVEQKTEPKAQPGERVFELRTYWAHPGKMKDLEARFRDHTCKLFAKHGMTIVGFWKPLDLPPTEKKNSNSKVDAEYKAATVKVAEAEYKLAAATTHLAKLEMDLREELSKSGAITQSEFANAKLTWVKAQQEEEVKKQALVMSRLDKADAQYKAAKVKVAEAEYKAASATTPVVKNVWDQLEKLSKLGAVNPSESAIAKLKWVNAQQEEEVKKQAIVMAKLDLEKASQPEHKLIYLLAFPSREAAEKSWADFRKDPDWIAAKKESEKDGTLVDKVESVFMKATDFSPLK